MLLRSLIVLSAFEISGCSYSVDIDYFSVEDGTGFGSAMSRYSSFLAIGAERDGDFAYGMISRLGFLPN